MTVDRIIVPSLSSCVFCGSALVHVPTMTCAGCGRVVDAVGMTSVGWWHGRERRDDDPVRRVVVKSGRDRG